MGMGRVSCSLTVAVLLGAVGCGPVLSWYGRSPDGHHRAAVYDDSDGQTLEVDAELLGRWDAVAFSDLAWTREGVVVPVRSDRGWHVWQAGELGPAYEAVGALVVEGEHVAYAALDEEGWRVVRDREPGPRFESIRAGSIVLAEGHVAYAARDASGMRAVVDGRVGPAYEQVEGLGFAGKGLLSAYAGYSSAGARCVIDGVEGPLFDDVLELALASDAPRWAAIVEEGVEEGVEQGGRRMVLHGASSLGVHPGADQLRISPEGAHVAWTALVEGRVEVWLDGQRAAAHDGVEQLSFVPRTDHLVYVAREEGGVRVVHDRASGPRFDVVDEIVISPSGHWGYAGHRRGVGSAIVVDGQLRYRGEWGGRLALAARGSGWAFVSRRAGERFVVTPRGRVAVPRPFVDTLVLSDDGKHWAIAVADRRTRRLRVLVDGDDVEPLSLEEVNAELVRGRAPEAATRSIVAAVLARITRPER